jgi:hypothetical protein
MTITAPTTQQVTSYVGQTWFDQMGNPMEETGHAVPQVAAERIAAVDKTLAGRWCFAVIKIKVREAGIDTWNTSVLFPDGKTRKLIQGELSMSQRTKGSFITYSQVLDAAKAAKVSIEVRRAPDTRFPWHANACETKLERFPTLIDFEKWIVKNNRPDVVLFVFEPGRHVRAPDESLLFAYLAIVTK